MPDTGGLICTQAQFEAGPFGDLVALINEQSPGYLADALVEATRTCEDEMDHRRVVPFTVTETHRAEGVDPDEDPGSANIPMDIFGTLGSSYAAAVGSSDLVRHCWLDQKGDKYQDMWSYTDVSVSIIRSYGGVQTQPRILNGPEPDTGHLWFQLGQFIPIGSRIQVTYTGGYNPIPASLVRAGKFMVAYFVVSELNPGSTQHDPDVLYGKAMKILATWIKD